MSPTPVNFRVPLVKSKQSNEFRYLLISLFLVLLCFFIMLNALSARDANKSKDVLQNMRYEFAGKNFDEKIKAFRNKERFYGSSKIYGIREEFEKYLSSSQIAESQLVQNGSFLSLSFRANLLFYENLSALKLTGKNMLAKISEILAKNKDKKNVTVSVTIYVEHNDYDLALERSEQIKIYLLSENLSEHSILFLFRPDSNKESDNKINFLISHDQ